LSALAPTRSNVFAQLAVLAQIGGNITCFLTACFAGIKNIFIKKQHLK
jgi:nucleoside permease NupC